MSTILLSEQLQKASQILLLPTNKGIELIDITTIVRVEAISNYSKLYFDNNKSLVVSKVLRWFEEKLMTNQSLSEESNSSFLRIHRTHLVNKKFILYYHSGKIKLRNGELIDVAKRRKSVFLAKLG